MSVGDVVARFWPPVGCAGMTLGIAFGLQNVVTAGAFFATVAYMLRVRRVFQ